MSQLLTLITESAKEDFVKCAHTVVMILFTVCLIIGLYLFNRISAKKIRFAVSSSRAQEELDVKCLQILRTLIHNEERKLPDDWTSSAVDAKVKKYGFICMRK